jgi:hypothetical protein
MPAEDVPGATCTDIHFVCRTQLSWLLAVSDIDPRVVNKRPGEISGYKMATIDRLYNTRERARHLQVITNKAVKTRAGNRVRTDDLLITNQLLYQLSYAGLMK